MERRTPLEVGRVAFRGGLAGKKAPDGTLWMTTSKNDGRPSTPPGDDDRTTRLRVT